MLALSRNVMSSFVTSIFRRESPPYPRRTLILPHDWRGWIVLEKLRRMNLRGPLECDGLPPLCYSASPATRSASSRQTRRIARRMLSVTSQSRRKILGMNTSSAFTKPDAMKAYSPTRRAASFFAPNHHTCLPARTRKGSIAAKFRAFPRGIMLAETYTRTPMSYGPC